jgi:hypothetical protein
MSDEDVKLDIPMGFKFKLHMSPHSTTLGMRWTIDLEAER